MNNLLENYSGNLFKNVENEWKERKETVSKSCRSFQKKHLKNQRVHVFYSPYNDTIKERSEVRRKMI